MFLRCLLLIIGGENLNYLKTEKSTRKSKAGREFHDIFSYIDFSPCQFYRQLEAIN